MDYAVALVAVTVAAWIQGSVGFGYALVAAPVLALLVPQMVPGPLIFASTILAVGAAAREYTSIDRRGVAIALIGRVPGTILGAAAVAWFAGDIFGLFFAGVVLVAVGLSLSGWRLELSTRNLLATGFTSGLMGTTTSIGGPPIALVYQYSEGPRLRATLNTYFALGATMSIAALAVAGHFGRQQFADGALLMPATLVGFLLSGFTRSFLDQGRTRAGVLAVAAFSAVAVVIRELLR